MPPYLTGPPQERAPRRSATATAPQAPPARASTARNAAAGAAVAVIVLQLSCAQVTLGLAVVFLAAGAIGRWRLSWLGCPALAGLAWALVIGPGRALAGYLAAAAHIVATLVAPGHPVGLAAVTSDWRHWLPAQVPLALIAAAAQAWVVLRLATRGQSRPGLLAALRLGYVRATVRRGQVATADGGCLGVVACTGRRVAVGWREAAAGVLVTGSDRDAISGTCLDLASAAIVHRKAVIVIDLTGGAVAGARAGRAGAATVTGSVVAACRAAAAPVTVLRPGAVLRTQSAGEEAIDLARALAGRRVVVFPPDLTRNGQAGLMLARLVIADLPRILAGRAGVPADGLIWINGCDALDTAALAALVACGARAGLAAVLGTASGPVAGALAGHVNVVVIRGQPPPGLAGQSAAPAGLAGPPPSGRTWPAGEAGVGGASLLDHKDSGVLPAALLDGGPAGSLSLLVREPVPRLVLAGRVVR